MAQLIWLITGCSPGGLGDYIARSVLARGDKVIATARNANKLQSLRAAGADVLHLDITAAQPEINAIIERAITVHGRIDVLVNNAGFIQVGTLEDLEYADWLSQFDTNVFGTIKVTKALLPHFRQRRSGTNVFVSSLSGWVGHGFCGAYAASKFALEGVAEALRAETEEFGIRTLVVEPGRFRTKLLEGGNRQTKGSEIADYAELVAGKSEGLDGESQRQPGDPSKLAEIVVDLVKGEGIAEGKAVPIRMPLGVDCHDDIKEKCEGMLRVLDRWGSVTRSTDFDGVQ